MYTAVLVYNRGICRRRKNSHKFGVVAALNVHWGHTSTKHKCSLDSGSGRMAWRRMQFRPNRGGRNLVHWRVSLRTSAEEWSCDFVCAAPTAAMPMCRQVVTPAWCCGSGNGGRAAEAREVLHARPGLHSANHVAVRVARPGATTCRSLVVVISWVRNCSPVKRRMSLNKRPTGSLKAGPSHGGQFSRSSIRGCRRTPRDGHLVGGSFEEPPSRGVVDTGGLVPVSREEDPVFPRSMIVAAITTLRFLLDMRVGNLSSATVCLFVFAASLFVVRPFGTTKFNIFSVCCQAH